MSLEQVRDSAVEGFVNINRAITEVGLVPRLDSLIRERDIESEWWVFDATEWTVGFPVPLRTRYVFPVSEKLPLDPEQDKFFIGISVIEGYSEFRSVDIGIGLSRHEMEKVSTRYRAINKADGNIKKMKPDWWVYSYPAYDFTQSVERVLSRSKIEWANAFGYGDYDVDKMDNFAQIIFETQEKDEEVPKQVWGEHQGDLEDGMNQLTELIDKVAKRAGPINRIF